jgi:hypothetical protein
MTIHPPDNCRHGCWSFTVQNVETTPVCVIPGSECRVVNSNFRRSDYAAIGRIANTSGPASSGRTMREKPSRKCTRFVELTNFDFVRMSD